MPLNHTTKVFAIVDLEIYKLTADVSGAATTYGSKIKVPGARELIVTETWKEDFLRGDNTLLDYEAARDTIRAVIRHGKLNFDAISALLGSTLADTGTTPAQLTTNTYAPADVPNWVKIEAQCQSVDLVGGDYHVLLGKAKIGGNRPFGLSEEAFAPYQFEVVAVPPLGTGSVWYQEKLNETRIAIV